ncbi:MAG: aminopeptidase [Candidatus Omnitrophota bacterium]
MLNENAVKAIFNGSLKLQPKESCLIVTDTVKEPMARAFYEYASQITPWARVMVMAPTGEHAAEPPEDIAHAMRHHNVQVLVTEKSLTHTKARREATERGARIATMPSITEEIANRCLDIDYAALKNESKRLYELLKNVSKVQVTTGLGTDMVFTPGSSEFFGKEGGVYDFPGAYGNLPEGEISFAPEECEGIYVVDASFPDLGLLKSPLIFKVKQGVVFEITGVRSDDIKRRLDNIGPKAYKVAELGIGLNPNAQVTGNVLEDEKVIGTVHIAVGNNLSYGRDNDVPLHLDGVITKPDIYVDGNKLMHKGNFV